MAVPGFVAEHALHDKNNLNYRMSRRFSNDINATNAVYPAGPIGYSICVIACCSVSGFFGCPICPALCLPVLVLPEP
jgi:hypothetical protein